jgi:DNA modification methylase
MDGQQLGLDIQVEAQTPQAKAVECLGMTFASEEARRAYYLEKLREKLKDPEFRQIEGFPIGEDEDILALSDPPYYTACPNPFIEEFLKFWNEEKAQNQLGNGEDNYHREPFAADVSEGKSDPIYNAHSYPTKVPPKAIVRYILHYTEPGDIVFDGFCGSGMTGVATKLCATPNPELKLSIEKDIPDVKWGSRRVILADISPTATFLARNHNDCPELKALDESASELINETRKAFNWLYKTNIKNKAAEIFHTVWSDVFICSNCQKDIVFWEAAVDANTGSISDELKCKHCGATFKKKQLVRSNETIFDTNAEKAISRGKQIPVLIKCIQGKSRTEKSPDIDDIKFLEKYREEPILNWYPKTRIDRDIDLWYERDYRPLGVYCVSDFFTPRNLKVLAALWEGIESIENHSIFLALKFAVTGMMVNLSRMNRWRYQVSFPYNPLSGTLYIGSLPVESNVFIGVENKINRLKKIWSKFSAKSSYVITTGSSSNLSNIPSNSVDYIFTDPPFGSNIIYSDLNMILESWLRLFTNTAHEAVVHRRKKEHAFTLIKYTEIMSDCFCEMYRVLKHRRWITVEFHNSQNSVWNSIQEALHKAGFVIADVRVLDKQTQTFKQVTAAKSVKQDLVISAYKPTSTLEENFKLEAGTEKACWEFIRNHLQQLPVFVAKNGQAEIIAERQNYLLFDRMVAFHIQRGVTVPLSASEFYAGLKQRFDLHPQDEMYFLPEQLAEYEQKRTTVKEILQLELIVINEETAVQWLRQQLTKKPQTFQELHPQFMLTKAAWSKTETPLELGELLEQSFLRYDSKGTIPKQIVSWLKQSSTHRAIITKLEENTSPDTQGLETDNPILISAAKDKWYVPDPNQAIDLEKLREKALLKEFEEYRVSKLKKLKLFRLEAVRAGFKKAWQERNYNIIVDVARKIPETILQEDSKLIMWYDQALNRVGDDDV